MKRSREGKVIISSAAAALYVILFSDQFQTLLYFSDPPKVRLSLGSSIDPKAISEGNDVYMDCEIRANPKAYKVEWSHNVRKIFLHSSTHCLNIVKKSLYCKNLLVKVASLIFQFFVCQKPTSES